MHITVIALLVPKRELFDARILEPFIEHLNREGLKPHCVASSHYVGALRAALEIQYTYDTSGAIVIPMPEMSDSSTGYGKGLDGAIALRKALAFVPRSKKLNRHAPLIVVVTESQKKLAEIHRWIGTGAKPRPCPKFSGGDFIVMDFVDGALKSFAPRINALSIF